jgi:hypothetical protein
MRPIVAATLVIGLAGCGKTPTVDTGKRVHYWVQVLQEPDAGRRKEAVFKLGNLGPTDPGTVLPALTAALKDADAQVRCEAILALVKCRPAADQAGPALADIQATDEDPQVREYAGKGLVALQEHP